MIVKFSIYEKRGILSLPYKDGDIVIIDKEVINDIYKDEKISNFLDVISDIQRIYIDDSIRYLDTTFNNEDIVYYFNNSRLRKGGKFYITLGSVKRKANSEEVKYFEAELAAGKFNL